MTPSEISERIRATRSVLINKNNNKIQLNKLKK